MGQFSMEISGHAGSVLSGNQHLFVIVGRERLRALFLVRSFPFRCCSQASNRVGEIDFEVVESLIVAIAIGDQASQEAIHDMISHLCSEGCDRYLSVWPAIDFAPQRRRALHSCQKNAEERLEEPIGVVSLRSPNEVKEAF